MKKIVLIMSWVTILVIGLTVGLTRFYTFERDEHIKEMGLACIHHVHNLSASASATLKDFYSAGINNPKETKILATMQCLQTYPLYEGGESFSGFNTTSY